MANAVEWEREHRSALQAIKNALAEKDRYLADEILERIAPFPEHGEVREPDGIHATPRGRTVDVHDPQSGQLSNENGPAQVKSDGTRKWYWKGMLHNTQGPAILKPNGDVEYYYLGTKCKNAEELDAIAWRAEEYARKSKNWRNVGAKNGAAQAV